MLLVINLIFSPVRNLLNETIAHCNSRRQFEKNLSEFNLVRDKLAR